jgi:hypothetical protein
MVLSVAGSLSDLGRSARYEKLFEAVSVDKVGLMTIRAITRPEHTYLSSFFLS